MTKRLRFTACLLSAIALFCGATIANADLISGESILLDFGSDPAAANTNSINAAGLTAELEVLDSLRVSDVSVNFSGSSFINAASSVGTAAIPAPFSADILDDWAGVGSSGTLGIQFSGLDDNLIYDITYAIGGFTDGPGQVSDIILSVDGQSQSVGTQSADGRFVTFTGLSTDSSGGLLFEVGPAAGVTGAGVAGSVPVISGLVITAAAAVPEPSSLALLGLGGLGMLMRRRK